VRLRAALVAALAAAALAACGEDEAPQRSTKLVDFSKKPPYVNGLDIVPGSREFLLTTNRGFWRIDAEEGEVTRVRGKISAGGKTSTVGTFLAVLPAGADTLIGSGHPDQKTLPSFLGFIRSDNGGKTWRVVSRLGNADLHKLVRRHGRLYAFDAVLSAMLISEDGGRTFEEHFTPRGLIIDFEVDPSDPKRIVASNESQLFRSEDEGEGWRAIDSAEGIRLAWPAPDALFRADKDGNIKVSSDAGDSWEEVGQVEGEPYKFKAIDAEHLYLAMADGAILETKDGGKSWEAVFEP
jgi:hypothetical protein